jgi:hypothetical protein
LTEPQNKALNNIVFYSFARILFYAIAVIWVPTAVAVIISQTISSYPHCLFTDAIYPVIIAVLIILIIAFSMTFIFIRVGHYCSDKANEIKKGLKAELIAIQDSETLK